MSWSMVGNAHSQGSCSVSLCLKAWRLWQGFRKLNAGVEGEVLRWEEEKKNKGRTEIMPDRAGRPGQCAYY
jgi:hypothetical protein